MSIVFSFLFGEIAHVARDCGIPATKYDNLILFDYSCD
jgi:hypothetical protein